MRTDGIRGHVCPANRRFSACRQCPRMSARARAAAPVSYPPLVAELRNRQHPLDIILADRPRANRARSYSLAWPILLDARPAPQRRRPPVLLSEAAGATVRKPSQAKTRGRGGAMSALLWTGSSPRSFSKRRHPLTNATRPRVGQTPTAPRTPRRRSGGRSRAGSERGTGTSTGSRRRPDRAGRREEGQALQRFQRSATSSSVADDC